MTRIIGCGNIDRSDDSAGILAARALRERGFDAIEHEGDGFALLELWHGSDDVILIDATVSGRPPGSVWIWDPSSHPAAPENYRCSTHVFGLAQAIELGRVVGRLPARIRIVGIEAANFTPGGAPSPEVRQAVDRVVEDLAASIHPAKLPAMLVSQ